MSDKGQKIANIPKHQSIFQNPLDRWIPRRFGINSNGGGQRKPVRVIPSDIPGMDNPYFDRLVVFPENGKISNNDY